MKYLYTAIIFCFLTTAIQAQTSNGNYSIPVAVEGTYSIVIRDPGGKTISKPVNRKTFYKGSTVDFEVNTKFWTSGKYLIVLENELGKPMDVRYIVIAPRNPKG